MTYRDMTYRDMTYRDMTYRDMTYRDMTYRDMTYRDMICSPDICVQNMPRHTCVRVCVKHFTGVKHVAHLPYMDDSHDTTCPHIGVWCVVCI